MSFSHGTPATSDQSGDSDTDGVDALPISDTALATSSAIIGQIAIFNACLITYLFSLWHIITYHFLPTAGGHHPSPATQPTQCDIEK